MTATERRFVLDTNIVISALLFSDSVPGRAFRQAFAQGRIISSVATRLELGQVVRRPKLLRYVEAVERDRFLSQYDYEVGTVEVTERIIACRDPNDDKFLELAIAGQAAAIITGDTDLLCLDPFRGIPIVTPAAFLEQHSSSR